MRVLCAVISSRVCACRVGVGLPAVRVRPSACRRLWRFGVGVRCRFRRLLWVGCRWWFWWLFGVVCGWVGVVCGWVYSLALTRSRLTDSRKTAHGSRLTACGCPLACRWCPCRRWCPSVKSYLFSVDNIAPMVGGYFTAKRQPKNGEQYVSALPHSHVPFSEHRTHPFGRQFRKPSQ